MKIEIEIFEDDQEPVTCARDISKAQMCQFLLTKRFGTVWYCRLFNSWDTGLEFYNDDSMDYLKPHPDCMRMRAQCK